MTRSLMLAIFWCLIATTASATEVREAVRLCDANPNCSYGDPDAGGGMLLVVRGDNGTIYVDCPPQGDCQILRRNPQFGAVVGARGVAGVLAPAVAPTPMVRMPLRPLSRTLQSN